jgi:hypothetical protein
LTAKRVSRSQDVSSCNILFISPSEEERLPRILKELGRTSVLTVGETEHFGERGGMINFRVEGERVRLEINVEATQRAGLKVSSQLLKLASIVKDSSSPTE